MDDFKRDLKPSFERFAFCVTLEIVVVMVVVMIIIYFVLKKYMVHYKIVFHNKTGALLNRNAKARRTGEQSGYLVCTDVE